jgi:phthalate 4,5-dioxygenase
MRASWVPLLLQSEFPAAGGRPVRARALGERMVAFRTGAGRVGLLAERCAHSAVSLAFGKVEWEGLRCSGHGYVYDPEGQCLEVPGVPPDSNLQASIRQRSYPCTESGGIVWAFVGSIRDRPEFVAPDWASLPEGHVQLARQSEALNYLEAIGDDLAASYLVQVRAANGPQADGILDDHSSAPMAVLHLPVQNVSGDDGSGVSRVQVWVPADDANTIRWTITWHRSRPLSEAELSD